MSNIYCLEEISSFTNCSTIFIDENKTEHIFVACIHYFESRPSQNITYSLNNENITLLKCK